MHNIHLIANHEARLISRSFLFRILCILAIGGINFLLWKTLCHFYSASWSWLMHCQSFSFPLESAYLYNIVQALVLLFVSAEVFTREQQRGPLEALHVRPAGNRELLLGKALGMIRVFLAVGLCSMLVSAGINLWGSVAPFSPWYYLYYFLTLTLPSLVFFTGFSLWVSWLTRSRGTSLAILAGFLYLSAVVLPGILGGLLDFTGSGLSNVFSVATGHVDGRTYALHRLAYLLAGAGFLCWTVRLHRRLPNNRGGVNACLGVGAGLVLAGALVLCVPLSSRLAEGKVREAYRKAFRRHGGETHFRVTRHDITVEQQGGSIRGTSELTLRNTGGQSRERLVLYLNPGFTVEGIEESGRSLSFRRDGQVLLVDRSLAAGDSVRLRLRYGGELDERVAYLELGDEAYHDTKRGNNFFHLGRRHALVGDDALVLVPELLWYPVAVSPVNPVSPVLTGRDYTLYRLRVVRPRQRVILSQGDGVRRGDTVEFCPPRPLEGLTLCGGDYEKKSVKLAGLQVEWFHFPGNDFIKLLSQGVQQEAILKPLTYKISSLASHSNEYNPFGFKIEDILLRQDWHSGEANSLRIVETPLSFVSHYRSWKGEGGYVQPGIILTGERGMGMSIYYSSAKLRPLLKIMNLEKTLFESFFSENKHCDTRNPFTQKIHFDPTIKITHPNPFYARPLFLKPTTTLVSSRYKGIDRVLKRCWENLQNQAIQPPKQLQQSEFLAAIYLQEHSLEEALEDQTISPKVLQCILDMKAWDLINRLEKYISKKEFCHFLREFYLKHPGEVSLEVMLAETRSRLKINFDSILTAWNKRELPCFLVKDLKLEQIGTGRYQRHAGSFLIQNIGTQTGHVSYRISDKQNITLQPGECKRVRIVNYGALVIDLGVSRNIPSILAIQATKEMPTTQDTTTGVWDVSPAIFKTTPNEIIVDNEDSGFSISAPKSNWLYRLFKQETFYTGIESMAPRKDCWTQLFGSFYHGKIHHSAHLKTAGQGKFTAKWTTNISIKGRYEIFVYQPDLNATSTYKTNAQYYRVSGPGLTEKELLLPYEKGKWISLGEFDLQEGISTIILDDRSSMKEEKKQHYYRQQIIIADAVKWVKVK